MSYNSYVRKTQLTRSEHINEALRCLKGPFGINNLESSIAKARSSHHAPTLRWDVLSNLLRATRHIATEMIKQGMDPKYSESTFTWKNRKCILVRKDTPENLNKLIKQIDELL